MSNTYLKKEKKSYFTSTSKYASIRARAAQKRASPKSD
jgi:hypothetical protein